MKSHIHILALGGTIASKGHAVQEFYGTSSLNIQSLLQHIENELKHLTITHEQYMQKNSHEISIDDLLLIAKRINHLIQQENIEGLVVVQGTNSMEEVAYFTSLVINTSKPIVFTGAMRPFHALGYDGLRNLYNSIILASYKSSINLGVLISFNDTIVPARYAVKQNPSILEDFSGHQKESIGTINGQSVNIHKTSTIKHTSKSQFNITNISSLPKVCIIYAHLGMETLFIETAVANGYEGIISAGFGKGYQTKEVTKALQKAIEKGIFVVRCSRTGQGCVNIEEKLEEKGFIAGGTQTPQKAQILLSIALTQVKNVKELQKIFSEY